MMTRYLSLLICVFAVLMVSKSDAEEAIQYYDFPSANVNAETLSLHGAMNHSVIEPVILAFQKMHPNVSVRYAEANTRELYENYLNVPENRPDVMISPAMDLQFKLANDGYALPYHSPQLVNIPDDAHWRFELFGFTYEPIVMAINSDILTGSPLPQSREQLLTLINEKNHLLDDKMGLFNIQKSGLGYLTWAYDGQQSRNYGRLLESFGIHQARLYTDTSAMLHALLKGQIFIAYNLVGGYSFEWSKRYPWIKTIMPTDYTSVIMRTAFISRQSTHPDIAKRFIDFLLSLKGQKTLAQQAGITPISQAITGENSRNELRKLPHGIFRPIPLGLELLIQTDHAKKQLIYSEWETAMSPSSHLLTK